MTLCPCCVPGRRTQLGWVTALALLAAGVLGMVVWTWTASAATKTNVQCLLDGYTGMKALVAEPPTCSAECEASANCVCIDWSGTSGAFDAFPSAVIDGVQLVLDLWDVAALAPGGVYGGLMLLVALLALLPLLPRCRPSSGVLAGCARAWNGLALLLLVWVAMVGFLAFGALGLNRLGNLNGMYDTEVAQPCTEQATAITTTLADAQTNLDVIGCPSVVPDVQALCVEAQASLDHAGKISTEFTGMCDCIDTLLTDAEPLAPPAVTGLVLVLLLLVAQVGVCVVLHCCRAYVPVPVAPVPPASGAADKPREARGSSATLEAAAGESVPLVALSLSLAHAV